MGLTEPSRELLKAHVKAHTRVINGRVVYINDYDTSKPQGTLAQLHERTVIGKHRSGSHYLRATDAEDGAKIQAAADKLGIKTDKRRAGANHHGRIGAYDHFHFENAENALAVHNELKGHAPEDEPASEHGQKDHGNASAGGNHPRGGGHDDHAAKSENAWEASKKAYMTNKGDANFTAAQQKAQSQHEAAGDAHALAHDAGKGRDHYHQAAHHYATAHAHAGHASMPSEVAEHASKIAGKLGHHADAHTLKDDHESYDQHSGKRLLAIEAHGRARGAHQAAADAARFTRDEKATSHHMKQADYHHGEIERHNAEMGKGHKEIEDRQKAAYAASEKAMKENTPEAHTAAAEAQRHAAKITYDSEIRGNHELIAKTHEDHAEKAKPNPESDSPRLAAAKPSDWREAKDHAIPPKPTSIPPADGQRPTATQDLGAKAASMSARSRLLSSNARGLKHERQAQDASAASIKAHVATLQAGTGKAEDHAKAAKAHSDAHAAHTKTAGNAATVGHEDDHDQLGAMHKAHSEAHAKLAHADTTAEKVANPGSKKEPDAPHGDATRTTHKAHHEASTRVVNGKVVQVAAYDDHRAQVAKYSSEARASGKAAFKQTQSLAKDPTSTPHEHNKASEAHAKAVMDHRDALITARKAGDHTAAAHHDEMSFHHHTAHRLHQSKGGKGDAPSERDVALAHAAFKEHYGENKLNDKLASAAAAGKARAVKEAAEARVTAPGQLAKPTRKSPAEINAMLAKAAAKGKETAKREATEDRKPGK